MAKNLGLDIDTMEKDAIDAKNRLNNLEKAVVGISKQIESSDKKLAPLINAIEQAQTAQKQAAANPTVSFVSSNPLAQGGIGLGQIMQLLGPIIGGGGMTEEMQKMNMRMMSMSIERMQADIGFTEAIKNAIVTKLAGKAAADLAV